MKKFDLVTLLRAPEEIATNIKRVAREKMDELTQKTENAKDSVINFKDDISEKFSNIKNKHSIVLVAALLVVVATIAISSAAQPVGSSENISEITTASQTTTENETTVPAIETTVAQQSVFEETTKSTTSSDTYNNHENNEDTTIIISGSFVAKDDTLNFEEGFFENPDNTFETATKTETTTEATVKEENVNKQETITQVETTTQVAEEKTVINLYVDNIEGDLVACTVYIKDNNGFYDEYQINGMKEISLKKGTYNVGIVEAEGYEYDYSKATVGEKGGYVIFTLLAK